MPDSRELIRHRHSPPGYLTVFDVVDRLGAEVYSSWDKKWRRDLAIPRMNPGGKILDAKQILDINLKTEHVGRAFQDALYQR